ncbi:MAG: M14-type cytosolic carboxypeptidase [Phycisphaeraceae bacterium]
MPTTRLLRHLLPIFFILIINAPALADLAATADFEGGSAVIESIDQTAGIIRMTPAGPADRGWSCWWYVKVTGIEPGRTITIDLGANKDYRLPAGGKLAASWARPQLATFSTDGKTWQHTSQGKTQGDRITWTATVNAKEAWFAWGPPFTPSDAKALVDRLAKASPHAKAFELCRTREDRPVPALRVLEKGGDDAGKYGIWINARQHAWEAGASWVCSGLAEWLVSDDKRATTLRRMAEISIVPIMDIDNTAIGAGGKEQKPQDHNRDWTDEPYHASVKIAQESVLAMNKAGRFDLFIDLHNPGPGDRQPFYFVAPQELLKPVGKRNLARFVECSVAEIIGPLKVSQKTRESGPGYDKNWKNISKNWVQAHAADHAIAVTLETSWNTPHSTIEGYQRVGRELGQAIERYLRESPREP